jgi:hypothetical protein
MDTAGGLGRRVGEAAYQRFRLYQYGYQWWLGRSYVSGREVAWTSGVGSGGQRLYISCRHSISSS